LAPHAARDWSLKPPCQALFLSASQTFEGLVKPAAVPIV